MAHSERRGEAVAMNIYGEQDMKLFESGVTTTHIREVYSYEWTDELCEKNGLTNEMITESIMERFQR